ncbi:MAG: hypothetical protein QXX63_02520 [Thermoplasmatales archaeon]
MRKRSLDLISMKLGVKGENIHLRYQIVGKALIMKGLPPGIGDVKKFADILRSSMRLWSVYNLHSINGNERKPNITLLSGITGNVTHREDGIIYAFDPAKVMFSKGNKSERHRLSDVVGKDETILDMFAGIGYFSIPLSLKAKTVYAAEINPEAFHYLIINKWLNHAKNLRPMLCDSSTIALREFADRIIMGHFDSLNYLPFALRYLKSKGEIHIHLLVRRGNEDSTASRLLEFKGIRDVKYLKVKEFSPGMDHIVFDLSVQKN